MDVGKNLIMNFNTFTHFIKGKISLPPMETILAILRKLESLEILVMLARKKRDEGLKIVNFIKV
jgi:hypothetical protein